MTTGHLQRGTGRVRHTARTSQSKTAPTPHGFQIPVPPFQAVYPNPPGHGPDHPLFQMHRAANRIYTSRVKAYRQQATLLTPPQLLDFIREDVSSNLLAVEQLGYGPLKIDRYVFLKGLHAWFPPHRTRAEALLMDFCRHYRKKRERISVLANNENWGASRPNTSEF